jgi:protein-disulfide isomerase
VSTLLPTRCDTNLDAGRRSAASAPMPTVATCVALLALLVGVQQPIDARQDAERSMTARIQALEGAVTSLQKQLSDVQAELARLTGEAQDAQKRVEQRVLPSRPVSIAEASYKGDPKAPIVVIEYSDFQCPFCRKYTRETYPRLEQEYVKTGRVRYVFRHLPLDALHPEASLLALGGLCAARQDRFWPLHDRLFSGRTRASAEALNTEVRMLGLDMTAFTSCLTDPTTIKRLAVDKSQAAVFGLTSTPTFFIGVNLGNDRVSIKHHVSGAQPFTVFREALERTVVER